MYGGYLEDAKQQHLQVQCDNKSKPQLRHGFAVQYRLLTLRCTAAAPRLPRNCARAFQHETGCWVCSVSDLSDGGSALSPCAAGICEGRAMCDGCQYNTMYSSLLCSYFCVG